jgi:hypothetical protein
MVSKVVEIDKTIETATGDVDNIFCKVIKMLYILLS